MAEQGTLYLCATPIGNLGDMTYRAVETLRAVDLVAAEDTRHTRILLAHYDIRVPMTSYHEHNKAEKGALLIEELKAGKNIVCVSDAGLPGIADPGADLARRAIAEGISVTPLPGANAALSALICAGLPLEGFTFVGFLPRKEKHRRDACLLRGTASSARDARGARRWARRGAQGVRRARADEKVRGVQAHDARRACRIL